MSGLDVKDIAPGALFAGRYEIVKIAGSGGMGVVCRAIDQMSGDEVALKVLGQQPDADSHRFRREADVLAALVHPAIVRYVDSGTTKEGVLYLAMEWLEGEDLARRLRGDGLSVRQSIALIRRVATALEVAHHRGVVHRDIKPSNLFLVDKDPTQVKLLDFGIARLSLPMQTMTRTGVMVGTLGYVAPEQACGERAIDGRADVFSLGCVLFECLTGQSAFRGARPVAVLAKILFGEMPRVSEFRPSIAKDLDDLVARMMSKEREQRPSDVASLIEALDALGAIESAPPPQSTVENVLTIDEQRFLSILFVTTGPDLDECSPTLTPEQMDETHATLRGVVEPLGGHLTPLGSGSVLVMLRGVGTAKDVAARAATCALAVRAAAPDSRVALATGPVEVSGVWPVGRVIDRVATLQETALAAGTDGVCIDDVTAALLDTRFELVDTGRVRLLVGSRRALGARRLLGKPTPCLGREKELAFLDGVLEDTIEDPAASAVLVSGPAGSGKSRLAHEFLERVRDTGRGVRVLHARGDPISAGSAFSLAVQLVRGAAGLHLSDPLDLQHATLRAFLGCYFDGDALRRASELLGELVGAPTTEEPSPQLLAARNDPRVKNEQLAAVFADWLGALTQARPLLLVIDDLHWGDLPSVNYINGALRALSEAPLMVLALARPEVVDIFPRLWREVGLQRLGLAGLKRRQAVKLVRQILGDSVDEETVQKTVERSGGNAFFLEELIRHVAERGDKAFPESVLAMAQSRLEALEPEARWVLRAGSVYGRFFWQDAVSVMLGEEITEEDLSSWFELLVRQEILEEGRISRFPGQREYSFRQNLLREAAYAMLTEADRELGHRLAAEWLEKQGEKDALVLADHFEKGGRTIPAIPYLVRAAQAAFDGGNLEATSAITERGLGHGATGADRGALLLFQAGRAIWTGEFDTIGDAARESLELLPKGSHDWFMALAALAFAGSFGGNRAALVKVVEAFRSFRGSLPPVGPVGHAAHALNVALIHSGQVEEALQLCDRVEGADESTTPADSTFMGYRQMLRGWLSLYGLAPLGDGHKRLSAALEHFEVARNHLSLIAASYGLIAWRWIVGDLEGAVMGGRALIEQCQTHGVMLFERWAAWPLGSALMFQGHVDDGLDVLKRLRDGSDHLLSLTARLSIATGFLLQEQLDEARRELERALVMAESVPMRHGELLAVESRLLLREDEPRKALLLANKSLETIQRYGGQPLYSAMARASMVDCYEQLEQPQQSRATLEAARIWLVEQIEDFPSQELAQTFLSSFPDHQRLMKLASERLG